MSKSLTVYQDKLRAWKIDLPAIHIVLGSGFSQSLDSLDAKTWVKLGEIEFSEIPGLTRSTVQDHLGVYRFFKNTKSGRTVCFQVGRLHGYEGHEAGAVVQTVMIPRLAGVMNFFLTNASGGLDRAMSPGDVMLIADHVNLTGKNPLVGANQDQLGPRFPDMGNLYSSLWRDALRGPLLKRGLRVHEGTYLGLLGPSFETHAEVRLFADWGLKAVGMSTVWEAIALKHSGAKLGGLALISNLGAGMSQTALDHEVILKTGRESAAKILSAICEFCEGEAL